MQRHEEPLHMPRDLIAFAAVFSCGLALAPAAAHVMELRAKIRLPRDEYLLVQRLYRGWELVAPIVILALVSTALLIGHARAAGPRPEAAAIVALACIAATQIVFWTFTFPVNRATRNWTEAPANWETLRRRWEFSHATAAVFSLVAFGAVVLAVLWS
jgi:hypothetical protein